MLRFLAAAAAATALACAQVHGTDATLDTNTTVLALAGAKDLVVSGGAAYAQNTLPNIRSGAPHSHTAAATALALTPGTTIVSVSLNYRYCTGYGPAGTGTNFTLRVAGVPVYASPPLTGHPYRKGTDPTIYSPPVPVVSRRKRTLLPQRVLNHTMRALGPGEPPLPVWLPPA